MVESGGHAELVEGDGPFARLWSAWHEDRPSHAEAPSPIIPAQQLPPCAAR